VFSCKTKTSISTKIETKKRGKLNFHKSVAHQETKTNWTKTATQPQVSDRGGLGDKKGITKPYSGRIGEGAIKIIRFSRKIKIVIHKKKKTRDSNAQGG